MNNNMSWLSLGNYINPKARNTELSNDYNQLTNRPIITLTGTSQNPIKLWKLDVGLYILNGYVQHTDALLSEARGLFVSATVGIVDGKYVMSAFIPFWEGQYEYILPSLSSETYTEHQMIRMITQGNSLTLDNIREYFPTQDYHPTTKKYVDETMDAIRNELGKMGLNNNDVQSLIKENRRRDIAIQALLSQNSDKMVTIDEEVHNISMDYSLDEGIATINTLEGDTLVNVSKDTEYDKVLSYEQDIVENTNTVDLEVDGNLNPIIVGDTLVNVCTQNNPTAITNEYTVEGSNHFALQDEVEGNCRPIIQGNTIVNRSKTKDITPLTTYVSEVEGNEMSLVNDTDTHVRVDKLVGDTMVSPMGSCYGIPDSMSIHPLENGRIQGLLKNGNYYIKKENGELCKTKPNTIYTVILDGTIECTDNVLVKLFYRINNETTKSISDFYMENNLYINKIATFTSENEDTFGFYFLDYDKVTNIDIKYIILEGDYTNKPIPQEYVKGLKNSYEDKCIPSDVWCNYNKGEINNSNIMSTITSKYSFEYKAQSSFSENISPANIMRIDRLNPNTTYTIGFKTNANCIMNMSYDNNDESQYTVIMGTNHSFTPNIFSMYSFTTPAVFNASHIRLISTDTSVRSITFSDIILLEGDYTSNPPTYEEVMEHSGKYRCKVEVQGKNLFDFDILANKNYTSIVTEDNMECIIFKSVTSLESIFDNCNFKQNTSYTLSYDCKYVDLGNGNGYRGTVLGFLYTDGSSIKEPLGCNYGNWMNRKVTSDPNKTVQSIIRSFGTSNLYVDTFMKNIQLEEGNTATAYEPYYNQTQTVYLNNPLLKGDEVVYKEGKLCHYHKMGMVVLDGNEKWHGNASQPNENLHNRYITKDDAKAPDGKIFSDNFKRVNSMENEGIKIGNYAPTIYVAIDKTKLSEFNANGFKQWFSENPTTVVYELANPYYETISTSELLLPITTNCKLLTSSNIPLTTMSTRVFTEEVNILANTQYSLNFNSDIASTVNITLGGTVLSNQAIVKGYNKFSITTPSTLVDNNNLLIIEGSGVNISEVVVTEYDEGVCEYIEGLKSSFEDGYIPSKNLLNDYEVIKSSNSTHQYSRVAVKPNTVYTLFYPSLITEGCDNVYAVYDVTGVSALLPFLVSESPRTFNTGNREVVNVYGRLKRSNGNLVIYTDPESLLDNWNKGLALLEGDWTHLHLTEEDFNHLGQYKVEYKVTGKNKFNPQNFDDKLVSYSYENNQLVLEAHNPTVWGQTFTKIQLKPNTYYILSTKSIIDTEKGGHALVVARKANDNALNPVATESASSTIFRTDETGLTRIKFYCTASSASDINIGKVTYANIQLEEGTVATEYEPYKESIQTVYLNSPLLEGDTIEEIDGEVYHVHRYGKVVLDGSEGWGQNYSTALTEVNTKTFRIESEKLLPNHRLWGKVLCNTFIKGELINDIEGFIPFTAWWDSTYRFGVRLNKSKLSTLNTNGFKQWLSENPTTIVYELENPTYELIPSSSIVCKSYPNGHLDFDTNVHIDNTVNFVKANLSITYANTSTNYKLQFVSDKDMENVTINALGNIMENVTINKGLNKISFTSPSDATNILTFEGLGYAYISNVQLVATDKDIDYFEGLYSTYECGLIEDESNENYGKYEVNIVSYNAPIQFGKGGKIE